MAVTEQPSKDERCPLCDEATVCGHDFHKPEQPSSNPLLARLRAAPLFDPANRTKGDSIYQLCAEAADEIERLREEVSELRASEAALGRALLEANRITPDETVACPRLAARVREAHDGHLPCPACNADKSADTCATGKIAEDFARGVDRIFGQGEPECSGCLSLDGRHVWYWKDGHCIWCGAQRPAPDQPGPDSRTADGASDAQG